MSCFSSSKGKNYSIKFDMLHVLQMTSDIRFVFIYKHTGEKKQANNTHCSLSNHQICAKQENTF